MGNGHTLTVWCEGGSVGILTAPKVLDHLSGIQFPYLAPGVVHAGQEMLVIRREMNRVRLSVGVGNLFLAVFHLYDELRIGDAIDPGQPSVVACRDQVALRTECAPIDRASGSVVVDLNPVNQRKRVGASGWTG